jgi:hypothetical protein
MNNIILLIRENFVLYVCVSCRFCLARVTIRLGSNGFGLALKCLISLIFVDFSFYVIWAELFLKSENQFEIVYLMQKPFMY